mmetsp:Transcript_10598/g.24766  ORF Transcript_10598/g.24766 Transcript_10598/m.24766 type:complete len:87 (+) Transcript_10598:1377-1637(+)
MRSGKKETQVFGSSWGRFQVSADALEPCADGSSQGCLLASKSKSEATGDGRRTNKLSSVSSSRTIKRNVLESDGGGPLQMDMTANG